MNYQQRGVIALAAVRFGLGVQEGVDLGDMRFTPELHIPPS
jgi:hypothetical protein